MLRRGVIAGLMVAVLVAALVALLAGRESGPTTPEVSQQRTRNPVRLASLSPVLTETLFALGAGPDVALRSAFCTSPPEALELPPAGTALAPDLQVLRAHTPTRIFTVKTSDANKAELETIAPLTEVRLGTPDQLIGVVHVLGRLTGHEAEAKALATRLAEALEPRTTDASPRVVVALGSDDVDAGQVWYLDPNTLHGRALAGAGLRHAVPAPATGRPVLAPAQLAEADPDLVVVWTSETTPLAPERRAELLRPFLAIEGLRAAREGHVTVVADAATFAEGPGIVRFVDAMREAADGLLER